MMSISFFQCSGVFIVTFGHISRIALVSIVVFKKSNAGWQQSIVLQLQKQSAKSMRIP